MSRNRAALRFLHLSDVHLGAAFPWLGERGAAHRRRLRQAFADAVARALDARVHLVLIAGDLFGSSQPHPDLTGFVSEQFGRLLAGGAQVVIAAGGSDALDAQGVYAGGAFDGVAGVTVFSATPKVVEFAASGASVSGRSAGPIREPAPFKGLLPGRDGWSLALVAYDPNRAGGRDALARSVAEAHFDYVALGGSHRTMDLEIADVPAWYPGSLELLSRGEAPGAALLGELGGEQPMIRPLAIARGRVQRLTLEPAAFPSPEALAAEIEAAADPDLSLEVRLSGRAHPAEFIDVAALERRLASRFFSLEIVDEAMPDLSLLDDTPGRSVTVTGKFVELMSHQLQQAGSEAERRRIGAACRLGLWLLRERREPA